MNKPDFCGEEELIEYLEYLDHLRLNGSINMFDATPYLQENFDLTKKEAREILFYWMETFSERQE